MMISNSWMTKGIVSALFLSQVCLGADFKIDKGHSSVEFVTKHLVSQFRGGFNDFDATFSFDPKKPDQSKVTATVKVASVDTRDKKRDDHLRSDDFFAAKKFPTFTFVSKSFTPDGDNKYKMAGDLTMKGVTKPVTFDVEFLGETKGFTGDRRLGFTATTKINRKDFGISWNKVLDSGGVVIGDDVQINLNVEAGEATAAKKM